MSTVIARSESDEAICNTIANPGDCGVYPDPIGIPRNDKRTQSLAEILKGTPLYKIIGDKIT